MLKDIYPYNELRSGFGANFYRPFYLDLSLHDLFENEIYSSSRLIKLEENENDYVLTLELPGFKRSELDVSLEKELLTIRAQKEQNRKYERSVTLPRGIDSDKIEAKLEDGVLNVVLPKKPESKARKIGIR